MLMRAYAEALALPDQPINYARTATAAAPGSDLVLTCFSMFFMVFASVYVVMLIVHKARAMNTPGIAKRRLKIALIAAAVVTGVSLIMTLIRPR